AAEIVHTNDTNNNTPVPTEIFIRPPKIVTASQRSLPDAAKAAEAQDHFDRKTDVWHTALLPQPFCRRRGASARAVTLLCGNGARAMTLTESDDFYSQRRTRRW